MMDTRDYETRLVNEFECESDELFKMLDQGHSPREIAETLKIELDTVMERFLDIYG